jgi:hypothetical protein
MEIVLVLPAVEMVGCMDYSCCLSRPKRL